MTRHADMEGVQSDYCHDEDINRYKSARIAMERMANQRFSASREKVCLLPGGLDGANDGLFWRKEMVMMVKDGILPPGIRFYMNGKLHEAVAVRHTVKIRRVKE